MKKNLLIGFVIVLAGLGGWFLRGLMTPAASPLATVRREVVQMPVEGAPAPAAGQPQIQTQPGTEMSPEELAAATHMAEQQEQREAERELRRAARAKKREEKRAEAKKRHEESNQRREETRKRRAERDARFPDPNRPTGPLVPAQKLGPGIIYEPGEEPPEAPAKK